MKYAPDFKLRAGAGGGDPANGLCYMETVALIAGEEITDHPKCACPVLTRFGVALNDMMPDDQRQKLLPLAYAMAGTRSADHRQIRMEILGRFACRAARMVADKNADPRVMAAIEAAEAYWNKPCDETRAAAYADVAALADDAGAAGAAGAAYAAAYAATYAATYAAADAAADAAYTAANDAGADIWPLAIEALREAIEAGPNSALVYQEAQARFDAVAPQLVGDVQ